MSTIPITFNEDVPPYTVLGRGEPSDRSGITVVLLNRGGRYTRRLLLQELQDAGFEYTVSIESTKPVPELESLIHRFPFVKFVLPHRELNLGEQINLGVREVQTPLFLVLWNDIHYIPRGYAFRLAERWAQQYLMPEASEESKERRRVPLCLVPLLQNRRFEIIPTVMVPTFYRGTIQIIPVLPKRDQTPSLFPYEGIGLYDRKTFMALGGYDGSIASPYWQLLDFGFRVHLWGEEILATQFFRLQYEEDPPRMDTTTRESYLSFYLKNIAPQFRGDHAYLPYRRLPEFIIKSRKGIQEAWHLFQQARKWVTLYRYRFKKDAHVLMKEWEKDQDYLEKR